MARGLAPLDGPGELDGAAEKQQLLGERGLAGVGVGDDGEGAATRDFVDELGHPRGFYRYRQLEDEGILAAFDGLVVTAPPAHLDEPDRLIERDRVHVRRADLEENVLHASLAGALDQQHQHLATDAAAAHRVADTEVEHVRFAGPHRHDAVRDDRALAFGDAA